MRWQVWQALLMLSSGLRTQWSLIFMAPTRSKAMWQSAHATPARACAPWFHTSNSGCCAFSTFVPVSACSQSLKPSSS
ncbi:hypothetical protein D3C83_95600 [compost metagenome]